MYVLINKQQCPDYHYVNEEIARCLQKTTLLCVYVNKGKIGNWDECMYVVSPHTWQFFPEDGNNSLGNIGKM